MLVSLEDVSSTAVEELGARPGVVGLVPLGALEQHGPHLPLSTDTVITRRLAEAIAQGRSDTVVVCPVLAVGLSDHHTAFPGTITVAQEAYLAVIRAHVDGFVRCGIERIAIFSHHGGNFGAMKALANEYATDKIPRVAVFDDLGRYLEVEHTAVRNSGVSVAPTDAHAGLVETSLMLYLAKDLCGEFENVRGYTANEDGWLARVQVEGVQSLSASGVLGKPAGATAAIGRSVFDALVAELSWWLDGVLQGDDGVRSDEAEVVVT